MTENPRLSFALAYAERGWAVFPLHSPAAGGCSCGKNGCERAAKHPRTENGLKDATRDPDKIREWWGRWGDANIGLATGAVSGLVVLDIDGDAGRATAKTLNLPLTPLAETGRGLHAYFAHPGRHIKNQQKGGWFTSQNPGLDLRGDGGYVVAPPSVHVSGRAYRWHDELTPDTTPLAPCPEWILNGGVGVPAAPAAPLPGKIPKGERHARLVSLAGSMRRRGADEAEIRAALAAVNAARCDPPYDERKIVEISCDIARRYVPAMQPVAEQFPPGGGGSPELRELGPDGGALTDLGNAERLAASEGARLRHVAAWGKWLVWTGTRWGRDETGEVARRFFGLIRSLYAQVGDIADASEKKKWVGHLDASESAPRIAAALKLAENIQPMAVPHSIFDSDTMRLNCLNGTLDLLTGSLRPHDPADHITKLAPADYVPDADMRGWEAFLEQVQPDPEVRSFLKRAVGYSLTGDVSEQVVFFLYGRGANGKSTFLGVLRRVLGDYAMRAAPNLISAKEQSVHPAERADLFGARLVVLSETERGERLAEALVKDLTGGDTIKARELYKPFFEFRPTHKIWLAANHKPDIRGADYAVWRRIVLIPWEVTIPPDRREKSIEERLVRDAQGILRWAVEGCMDWQRGGLSPPRAVLAAVADYKSQADILGEWLETECALETGAVSKFADLYDSYVAWSKAAHEAKQLSRKVFAGALDERGFDLRREGKGRERMRIGVRLANRPSLDTTVADGGNGARTDGHDRRTDISQSGATGGRIDTTSIKFSHINSRVKTLYGTTMHLSADSDSSVRQSAPVHIRADLINARAPRREVGGEWFTLPTPPFVAFVDEEEVVFRGQRDPDTGRWFPGDLVPHGVPEANLAALRARGALTRSPPPSEAAHCPRCGGVWHYGGARGWVWTCCGQPAPAAIPDPHPPKAHEQPEPPPPPRPGRCPPCGQNGAYLYPSQTFGFPVCSKCDPTAAKAALEPPGAPP